MLQHSQCQVGMWEVGGLRQTWPAQVLHSRRRSPRLCPAPVHRHIVHGVPGNAALQAEPMDDCGAEPGVLGRHRVQQDRHQLCVSAWLWQGWLVWLLMQPAEQLLLTRKGSAQALGMLKEACRCNARKSQVPRSVATTAMPSLLSPPPAAARSAMPRAPTRAACPETAACLTSSKTCI